MISLRRTAHEVRALNRRPGGAATDHPSPIEHGVKSHLGLRVQIRIGQTPLPAASKPNCLRVAQHRDELIRVGFLGIASVQQVLESHAPRVMTYEDSCLSLIHI